MISKGITAATCFPKLKRITGVFRIDRRCLHPSVAEDPKATRTTGRGISPRAASARGLFGEASGPV